MAFTIGQRVFFSGTKACVRAEAGDFTRPLAIGNNWNSIRVAMLCAINGSYSSTQSLAIPWALGLCNGQGSGYGQQFTNHFVGWATASTPLQTYTANSGNPYYVLNGVAARKVGLTTTTASTGSTNINIASTEGTNAKKSVLIMDIVKSFTSIAYSTNTAGFIFQQDVTVKDFLELLMTPATGTLQGLSTASTTQQTLTGSESAGNLDTFNFYWGSTVIPFEIYAMAVYRNY